MSLDSSDFAEVRGAIELFDDRRETVIKKCRDSQKLAKQAIFSLHRSDQKKAEAQLKEVEQIAQELLPLIQESPYLRSGSYSSSMEEYGEAVAFFTFLKESRLVRKSELPLCDPEEYLGGILDFTGELNRYTVRAATARDKEAVKRSRDLCEAIMGEFLQFNLRNSNLRKKFDGLKYTLKKLENTLYELSLTESLGLRPASRDAEQEGEMEAEQKGQQE